MDTGGSCSELGGLVVTGLISLVNTSPVCSKMIPGEPSGGACPGSRDLKIGTNNLRGYNVAAHLPTKLAASAMAQRLQLCARRGMSSHGFVTLLAFTLQIDKLILGTEYCVSLASPFLCGLWVLRTSCLECGKHTATIV